MFHIDVTQDLDFSRAQQGAFAQQIMGDSRDDALICHTCSAEHVDADEAGIDGVRDGQGAASIVCAVR